MRSRKKTSAKRFLIIFLLMVIGLSIASQLLYSFYIQMFNDGLITDVQMSSFADVTLAIVISITVIVGIRYVWRTRLIKQIRA